MKANIITYVMIFFIVIMIFKIYRESDLFQLKCIISNVDGKSYCVRERPKLQLVADLLAETTQNMTKIVKYLGEKYPERENVKRLVKNYNPRKILDNPNVKNAISKITKCIREKIIIQ